MPSKKTKPTISKSAFADEIQQIKSRQTKTNLYLEILDQDLVDLADLAAYAQAKDINIEIKEFVLKRLKELTGSSTESTASFTEDEVKALKFIANKVVNGPPMPAPKLKKAAPEPEEIEEEEIEEESEEEEEEVVQVVKKVPKKIVKIKKSPKTEKEKFVDSHLIKTPVKVRQADGTEREEISVTHKIIIPPANIRRVPPPTFEQEYLQARANTAGFQRTADQLQSLPMNGAVTDTSED